MARNDLRARLEPSWLERGLSHIAPRTAQRLHAQRVKFEVQGLAGGRMGGYIGARRDRAQTEGWLPGGGSAATDQLFDLPMLRERSRDQMRNAAVAVGGLNTDVLHVVGTGLSYTPRIDAEFLGLDDDAAEEWACETKRRFKAWAESPDCHLQRQIDFYSIQELCYRSWLESGDVFILTPMVERNGVPTLALQIIEADRVCNPLGRLGDETMQDGIELDPATGEPIAIHVAKYHPGDFRGKANTWERVEIRGANGRRNVIHLFDMLRPGQVRGVPWVAPILEVLKQLGKWSDSELNAAVVSSIWAVFVKMDHEAFAEVFDDDQATKIVNRQLQSRSREMESGKVMNLLPGEEATIGTPGRPNPEFDPFWTAMVRQVGMTLGIPYEVLVMHFQSSYTAARGALLVAWRRWNQRRDKIAKGLCQPVADLWLAQEVSAGRIAAPGFFANPLIRAAWGAGMWTGDGPGSVDPVKEVDAATKRVALGISTVQAESIAFDGQDWEGKQRQREKEVAQQREAGTAPPAAGGAAAPAPEPADPSNGPPGKNTTDDGSDDDTETPPVAPSRARRMSR